jgi:hypothetical protein
MLKTRLALLFFIFLFLFLSTNALAYQEFTKNSNMNNASYFFIQDIGYNATDQQCMNVTSTGSSLIFTNLYCPTNTLSGYIFSMQPLSTNEFVKSENLTLELEYFYNDSKAFLIPKNKETIIYLNYSISNNTGIDTYGAYLTYSFSDGKGGNLIANKSTGSNFGMFFLNASNIDRNLTVDLNLLFNSSMATNMNITFNKFEIYTLDKDELRSDFLSDNIYNQTELERYCGSNSTIFRFNFNSYNIWNNFSTNNNTAYLFGYDSNNISCGFIKLGDVFIARHWFQDWKYYPDGFYEFYTPNLLFVHTDIHNEFNAFFEAFLRNQVKITILHMNNLTSFPSVFFLYNDTQQTILDANSFRDNYTYAFRQMINLINNSNISMTNQNPSGTGFQFVDGRDVYNAPYNRTSISFPFFSSSIVPEGIGWQCSVQTNTENYFDSNGNITISNYCGNCGCGSTRCATPTRVGSWCNDYNFTKPCCNDLLIEAGWATNGACAYTNCYDSIKELPNPFNASQTGFTTYSVDCSSSTSNSCPTNSMCVQFANPNTHLWEGRVMCISGTRNDTCFDDLGNEYNCSQYIQNITPCVNPSQYTNQFTCYNNGCSWCPTTTTCQSVGSICYNPSNPPNITSNAFGWTSLQFGSLFGMSDVSNLSVDEAMLSLLISLITGIGILWVARNTEHASNGLTLGFLGTLTIFTIGLGNLLLWTIYIVLIIISAGIMTGYFSKLFGGG